ncbi:MAG: pilus assembly protein [Loktanella sp.]|nr:pilus assembly protein [Loktanella sp.]
MATNSFIRRFCRADDGAVAVEFVLIAPLLIALVFGIMCFGYLFGASHAVHQLAFEAARASVQGLTQAERVSIAHDYLDRAIARYPLLRPDRLTQGVLVSGGGIGDVTVTLSYAVDGSILGIADTLLGLEIASLEGRAFLAY